jgi:hypothetical protein
MAPPYLGLFIFAVVLMYKPVAHCVLVLQHHFFTGSEKYLVGFLVGLLGVTLVGKGLRRDELTATAMGYMGGALIWMGWFEYTFDFFGQLFALPPIVDPVSGAAVLSGNLQVLEATVVPFVAMLILFGNNRETRCRLLMWFHRNTTLAPEKPTTGYKRNYAWVTAWEAIFVTWAFYLQIILLYDPRVVGFSHPVTFAVFFAYLAWGLYLLSKLMKHAEPAAAIRYAIPTTAAFWITIEMGSHWGWFTEIWVRPIQFPVSNAAFIVAFAAGAALILRPRASSMGIKGTYT